MKKSKTNNISIDVMLPRDEHDRESLKRRKRKKIGNKMVYIIAPEDFVLQKLKVGRPRDFEDSVKKVSSIMITTAAYITTDAIKLAMDHNIDIIFLDEFGDPFGRVWHSKLGSTTLIRRRQLEIADTLEGLKLAVSWVINKFDNQIELLKRLRNTRTQKSAEITAYIEKLENCRGSLDNISGTIDDRRGTIMGIEGSAGRVYFECLRCLMPDRYRFDGRSRNPAKDEFNALLNYSYGVLYSKVEKACIIAGLDPYVGIIHTDHYNKKSLG